jgi:hypothetical protein
MLRRDVSVDTQASPPSRRQSQIEKEIAVDSSRSTGF